jgi:periplasmic divalent cation tolerance protein
MEEPLDHFIQIVTTTDDEELAGKIAHSLVENRLAGCVQVLGPITSVYRWKGQIEKAQEWQCLVKTRQGLYEAVEKAIKAIHPYETPEIIALPIEAGSLEYLTWLRDELAGG